MEYNDLLTVLMLVRVYHIVRSVIIVSKYVGPRAQRISFMNGSEASTHFAIKSILAERPFDLIAFTSILCILMGAFALRIFERPLVKESGMDFSSYSNSVWCVVVTMTTVGYGDYFPVTIAGRIIGFAVCLWGIVSISLFVASTEIMLKFTQSEENSYDVL